MHIIDELYHSIEQKNLWSTKISLKRGDFLSIAGEVESNLYFVKNGTLKIFILDGDEERIVRFGYQNDIITALDSFISGNPSDFTIQALKKTEVFCVKKTDILALITENSNVRTIWNQILHQLVLEQIEREKDLLTSSPQKRYERVLQRSPQLFQEVPNKHIASYLRMTPETLSRLKKS